MRPNGRMHTILRFVCPHTQEEQKIATGLTGITGME